MTHKIPLLSIVLVASLVFLLPASGIADGEEESEVRPYDANAAAEITAGVSNDLRNCGFERRDEFVAAYKARHARLSANLEQLRANHSAALASPQRNEAMARLDADNAAFEQKLSEADDATVETWNAARDSVAASWDKLQASYSEVSDGG